MKGKIYVSGVFRMPQHVRKVRPSHLVSIIQPEFQPDRPPEVDSGRHLRVPVHDIVEPDGIRTVVNADHVADIVQFLETWDAASGGLLVHCFAGVSRSSAVALVAHVLETGEPAESARELRRAAPHASPNRLIVQLADAHLGLQGSLLSAVEEIGPGTGFFGEEGWAVLEV